MRILKNRRDSIYISKKKELSIVRKVNVKDVYMYRIALRKFIYLGGAGA